MMIFHNFLFHPTGMSTKLLPRVSTDHPHLFYPPHSLHPSQYQTCLEILVLAFSIPFILIINGPNIKEKGCW